MITSHVLSRAEAGPAAIVAAAFPEVPGVPGTARVAGSCDVIAQAGTRDAGEPAGLVTSRARAPAGATRTVSCPVARR